MFLSVSLNLDIQTQYVDLLREFQDSQHKALQYGEYQDVFQLEVAIQKSLRSLQIKRRELRETLTGDSVKEFADRFPKYIGDMLRQKLEHLETLEQEVLAKATRNADLAMVLAGMKAAVPEHWNVFPAGDISADASADAFTTAAVAASITDDVAGEMVQ